MPNLIITNAEQIIIIALTITVITAITVEGTKYLLKKWKKKRKKQDKEQEITTKEKETNQETSPNSKIENTDDVEVFKDRFLRWTRRIFLMIEHRDKEKVESAMRLAAIMHENGGNEQEGRSYLAVEGILNYLKENNAELNITPKIKLFGEEYLQGARIGFFSQDEGVSSEYISGYVIGSRNPEIDYKSTFYILLSKDGRSIFAGPVSTIIDSVRFWE